MINVECISAGGGVGQSMGMGALCSGWECGSQARCHAATAFALSVDSWMIAFEIWVAEHHPARQFTLCLAAKGIFQSFFENAFLREDSERERSPGLVLGQTHQLAAEINELQQDQ